MKFKVFINTLVVIGLLFSSTASAQGPATPKVKIQNNCYEIVLSASVVFDNLSEEKAKRLRPAKVHVEWAQEGLAKKITDKQDYYYSDFIGGKKLKFVLPDLEPDTIYSYYFFLELPPGVKTSAGSQTQRTSPELFKTNTVLNCTDRATEAYFNSLDVLSSTLRYDPNKNNEIYISAPGVPERPGSKPISQLPAGTIVSGPVLNCRTNVVAADNGTRLCGSIVEQYNAMIAAAAKEPYYLELRPKGPVSAFRLPQEQAELRRINGCKGATGPCRIPTAPVGTSNHESGFGVDFQCNRVGIKKVDPKNPCVVWLKANAARFGFKKLPSEDWHWSTDGR